MKNKVTHIINYDFANNGYPKHIVKKRIYNSNIFDGPTDDNANDNYVYRKVAFISNFAVNSGYFKGVRTFKDCQV